MQTAKAQVGDRHSGDQIDGWITRPLKQSAFYIARLKATTWTAVELAADYMPGQASLDALGLVDATST